MTSTAEGSGSHDQNLTTDAEKQSIPEDVTPNTDENAEGSSSQGNGNKEEEEEAEEYEPEPEFVDPNAPGAVGALGRVLSRISTNASRNPGPPPNGGKTAWLQVVAGHLIIANTWGFITSFGVFQTYYTTTLGRSHSDISWIGSIAIFLTFFGGAFTGRLVDGGFLRPVVIAGTGFLLLGVFTLSAATEYYQVILAQGFSMGICNGLLFCCAISNAATYFSTRRSFALGIVASGTVTGGLIYPAVAQQLLPKVGFGWTVRVIGFIMLATMAFVCVFIRSRLPPRTSGALVEPAAFKQLEYTFYAIGMFFNFWGVYVVFFYLGDFSHSQYVSPPLSSSAGINLILVLNGVGLFGRVIPNYLADKVGPLNLMFLFAFLTGIFQLIWIGVTTPAGLYVWASFNGIISGGVQSLFPAGLSSLISDPRKQGTRIGMVLTIVSFATLTGTPIAGAIITASGGQYVGAQLYAGLSLVLGSSFIFASRIVRMRRTGESFWKVKI